MMKHARVYAALAAVTASLAAFSGAIAQAADFYQGKRLTMIINFTAGGPTDIEGRMFARHLEKHLPGKPQIIVRNIGGAGGVVGTNFLGRSAKPDGLTFGYFTALGSTAMMRELQDTGLEVDPLKFRVIATVPGLSIAFMRTDVPPGIKKPEDIVKAKGFKMAGLNHYSSLDLRARMVLDMLGVEYQYVTGYRGTADSRAAVQKNEVQYSTESQPSFQAVIMPTMVKTGMVVPIMYYDVDDGETVSPGGEVAKNVPAPTFTELYRRIKGSEPSGLIYEAFRAVNRSGGNVQRLLVFPEGTPDEPVNILRKAVADAAESKEYKEEALKTLRFEPEFIVGERAEKLVRASIEVKPEVIEFLRGYIAKVQKGR